MPILEKERFMDQMIPLWTKNKTESPPKVSHRVPNRPLLPNVEIEDDLLLTRPIPTVSEDEDGLYISTSP